MGDIQLFVCCHHYMEVPPHPLLVPLQVGSVLAETRFPSFLYDDIGDNISAKNRSYCELTGQYWAWKNVKARYYGIFHYRRYLYPGVVDRLPYRIAKQPTLEGLNRLGYDCFEELIEQHDLILPKAEDMHISVREHYATAQHHHAADLSLAEQILRERYPEMARAAEHYLSGTKQYFGNISIMRWEVFRDYCTWLFGILEEFDRRADTSGYSQLELRVDGYLAERLLGIYAQFRQTDIKVLELPRIHFYTGQDYWQRKMLNNLFPPGTRRRAAVKKLCG